MRESKIHSIVLNNVSKKDLAFIQRFEERSKEVLEHLIKAPYGVLEIEHVAPEKYYLVKAILKPN